MKNMRVGLVFGGNTTEGEVSKSSANGVRGALQKLDYDVVDIEFDKNIALKIMDANVDVIFNAMHGQYGEDGSLQGMLNIMQIPYTHSGCLATAISINKPLCKQIFQELGIKVPQGFVVSKEELYNDKWKDKVKNSVLADKKELFIKPSTDGSSKDAFLINDVNSFSFKSIELDTASKTFLVEERIKGREIQVAVVGNEPVAIGGVEIKPKGDFYDFHSKYDIGGSQHIPLDSNDVVIKKVFNCAVEMHSKVGLKSVSRSDFLLTSDNEIVALEINANPGLTPTSLLPDIAMNNGVLYEDLVKMLLDNAGFGD